MPIKMAPKHFFYLLYISICGLPHVIILNNTRQGLPGQLEKERGHKINHYFSVVVIKVVKVLVSMWKPTKTHVFYTHTLLAMHYKSIFSMKQPKTLR